MLYKSLLKVLLNSKFLFAVIIFLFIFLGSSFFSIGLEDSGSGEDIVGSWRASSIIYDGKKKLSIYDKDLFYIFASDGTGRVTLSGDLISRFIWFVRDSALYIDKLPDVLDSDKSKAIDFSKSIITKAAVVREKSSVKSIFGDIDSYFFNLLRSGEGKDFFSLVFLERFLSPIDKKPHNIELDRRVKKYRYYNYVLHMPFRGYDFSYNNWEYNASVVFSGLLGKRVVMNKLKVSDVLAEPIIKRPVDNRKRRVKRAKPRKVEKAEKRKEIIELDKPLLFLKERAKQFEIINETE